MIKNSQIVRGTLLVLALSALAASPAYAKHAPKTPETPVVPVAPPAPEVPKEVKTPANYLAESWNHYIYFPFLENLGTIPTIPTSSSEEQASCDRFYSKVKSKGEMKITLGIGYYDFSEGETFGFDYLPDGAMSIQHVDFGMNATIDNTYQIMYSQILKRRCTGNLQVCGFQEDSRGVFSKMVQAPDGQRLRVVVELRDSSVTSEHAQNVGPLKDQQTAKSDATTQWFFDSIRSSDMVIYNGHSRKGGGPDFSPPRLLSTLHVDYGWYGRHTPGLNRLLAALKASPEKPSALFLMSCNSALLFEQAIKKAAPQTAFAGTNAVIPGDLPTKGALAGMDSFMKFQCKEGFAREMQSEQALLEQIKPLQIGN
jgi:hypothetical protein